MRREPEIPFFLQSKKLRDSMVLSPKYPLKSPRRLCRSTSPGPHPQNSWYNPPGISCAVQKESHSPKELKRLKPAKRKTRESRGTSGVGSSVRNILYVIGKLESDSGSLGCLKFTEPQSLLLKGLTPYILDGV